MRRLTNSGFFLHQNFIDVINFFPVFLPHNQRAHSYLGKLHISQVASSAGLRKVQCGQVQSGWFIGWLPMEPLVTSMPLPDDEDVSLEPLPNAAPWGKCDEWAVVAEINWSTVAQFSEAAHSITFCLSFVRRASSSGPMCSWNLMFSMRNNANCFEFFTRCFYFQF